MIGHLFRWLLWALYGLCLPPWSVGYSWPRRKGSRPWAEWRKLMDDDLYDHSSPEYQEMCLVVEGVAREMAADFEGYRAKSRPITSIEDAVR